MNQIKKKAIISNENIGTASLQSSKNSTIKVTNKKVKLVNVCETRWVDRHVAVETFNSLYSVVIELLIDLIKSKDRELSVKSNLLYSAISSSEFLCSLTMLNKLLSFTINVARKSKH